MLKPAFLFDGRRLLEEKQKKILVLNFMQLDLRMKKKLEIAIKAAIAAGKAIMEVYNSEDFQIENKEMTLR